MCFILYVRVVEIVHQLQMQIIIFTLTGMDKLMIKHQMETNTPKLKMYAIPGLLGKCIFLFQKIKWIFISYIGSLHLELYLSSKKTLVHTLDLVGMFAGRYIVSITWHRTESSLKPFFGQISGKRSKTLRTETCMKKIWEIDPCSENSSNSYFYEVKLKM